MNDQKKEPTKSYLFMSIIFLLLGAVVEYIGFFPVEGEEPMSFALICIIVITCMLFSAVMFTLYRANTATNEELEHNAHYHQLNGESHE